MPSRRRRKRYQRETAEATARTPGFCRGWGRGAPIRYRDVAMVRRAIREGWQTPEAVQQRALNDLLDVVVNGRDDWLALRIVWLLMWLDGLQCR